MVGHPLRTRIPSHKSIFDRRWSGIEDHGEMLDKESKKYAKYFNAHTICQVPLEVGQRVQFQSCETDRAKLWKRDSFRSIWFVPQMVQHFGKTGDYYDPPMDVGLQGIWTNLHSEEIVLNCGSRARGAPDHWMYYMITCFSRWFKASDGQMIRWWLGVRCLGTLSI